MAFCLATSRSWLCQRSNILGSEIRDSETVILSSSSAELGENRIDPKTRLFIGMVQIGPFFHHLRYALKVSFESSAVAKRRTGEGQNPELEQTFATLRSDAPILAPKFVAGQLLDSEGIHQSSVTSLVR